ncbi:hypothetical protein [Rahnella contaminans]|uniref:hypothetical protein n=1 Tax=Rahnella contaminans TaxID=2703882 RepID=UPI0023DC0B73|nr:hypothetical protein [Rahnella contaminans]MDF1896693.1 hypothetical protein [Rahnella contaminans]
MHTHNVNSKTATTTPPERWVAKSISHIFARASYNVACMEEAHAHYGEKFTRWDAYVYFVQGAVEALVTVIHKSFSRHV